MTKIHEPVLIYGAGGFARELASWLYFSQVPVCGFFSDHKDTQDVLNSYRVFKELSRVPTRTALIGIGDPLIRKKIFFNLVTSGFEVSHTFFSSGVTCGLHNLVGAGTIICPGVTMTTNCLLGQAVLVNINATIGHDCQIQDFVTISPGANISGNVKIGECAYIGSNAVIREKVKIGARAVIGAGAVVVKDVEEGSTVVGNPARPMKLIQGDLVVPINRNK